MKTIVTLTMNPALDKSAQVDRVVPEHKLRCTDLYSDPGGGGLNVSRAIHRLGGHSEALYLAGGPAGELLHRLLSEEGIKHRALPLRGWTRESFTVLETTTGQQFRFNLPGPTIDAEEWSRCLEALSKLEPPPDYLVASGSLPPGTPEDFYAQVARLGAKLGARVVVDASQAPLRGAIDAGVFMVKPNLRELSQIAGRPLLEEGEQEAFAQQLVDSGKCEVVLLSFGAGGALLVTRKGRERLRSPTVPIRSAVGAGDSMVGGFVLALARGSDVSEAARFGVAAGAAAVMTAGTGLCRREDAERLYARVSQ